MFNLFKRKQNLPEERSGEQEETVYRERFQPVLEAVSQVMICGSWDELLAVFTQYSEELKSPEVAKLVRGMREAFKEDAHTSVLIEQRAGLFVLHREKGIVAVLQHHAINLNQPTSALQLFARIAKLRSVAEVKSAGLDVTKFFIRR